MARTRAKDFEDKRQAILDRAARIFAQGGYDRTSMAVLAAECGVSKPLLYHYYESKDGLLFDIIEGHLLELIEAVERADAPHADAVIRLRGLIRALLAAYRDADAEHKVQIDALATLPREQRDELKALERRLVDIFADAAQAVNPELDRGGALLKPATMSLFGMLNWCYMWFQEDGPLTREEYADLTTTLFVNGIRALR